MGLIINIDEALKNRTEYNILREPINDMLKNAQEAWEQKNPVDLLFTRGTLDKFQETYTDSIGFARAFAETSDYAVAPLFNTHEGFSKVYTSRTFQGGFVITQQVLEDQAYGKVKDTANRFIKRWHGDIVDYAMTAIGAGFGKEKKFDGVDAAPLKLLSADTATGKIGDPIKCPLFSKAHTIVRRENDGADKIVNNLQSNAFYVLDGTTKGIDYSDAAKVGKMADVINQVITAMENYRDDNGKYAGVLGQKRIVIPNDAQLNALVTAALEMEMLSGFGPNPAYKRAVLETTPYLRDQNCCMKNGKAVGFFIVDPAYNAENHGPEFTERVALTLNVENRKNPYGIAYDARQRFDVNVASWRGIAYVYIGNDAPDFNEIPVANTNGTYDLKTGFDGLTAINPMLITKPVSVVGTVTTKQG